MYGLVEDEVMPPETGILTTKLNVLHEDVTEIKQALGKLSDAITKLALVEERQTQAASALERTFVALDKIELRLQMLERDKKMTDQTVLWVNRAVWAAVVLIGIFAAKNLGLL